MRKPRYLVLDNKRYLWRDILKLRREQCKAAQQAQPVLFNLQDDERPKSQRTAAAIYEEHRRWKRQHAEPLRKFIAPHANRRDADSRYKISKRCHTTVTFSC